MILMNDFKAEPQGIRDAMLVATKRVLDSGWYVLGPEVQAFEKEWASVCGVTYAVGVANGMDAIEIAIRALNIGPGDEVITTPMTAFASVLAILRSGAQPVLADIDSDTGLLSIESVSRSLSPRTKAIVLVHLHGHLHNVEAWIDFCNEHRLELIEDCAQAHLAKSFGKTAGSFGKVGAYSFYPTKNLGALGDAGMLVTNDEEIALKAQRLRNYGQSVRYHHPELGMNSRLDELHAAMLGVRLKWLAGFTDRRREIADAYRKRIKNPLVTLLSQPQEYSAHVYHLFVVLTDHRDSLQYYLEKCGIQALIHYPVPIHYQEPCKNLARDPLGLKNAEEHASRCLSLPCHPQMTDENINLVIESINYFSLSSK